MPTISISDLKVNPGKAVEESSDMPIQVQKRNKVKAYLVGKELFEKIVLLVENRIDISDVKNTDYSKGRNFEEVVEELGL